MDLYQDYVVLLLAGKSHEEAIQDVAEYAHPIQVARLEENIAAREEEKKEKAQ